MTESASNLIRVWMREVMLERGISCGAWARRAGVSPTTLTRFLNDETSDHVPSTRTLVRLSAEVGSQPNLLGIMQEAVMLAKLIPQVDPCQYIGRAWDWGVMVSESDIKYYDRQSQKDETLVAVVNRSTAMRGEGLHPGDVLLVRPREHGDPVPAVGTMVLIRGDDDLVHPARYMAPWIVFAHPESKPVLAEDVMILGVIRRLARNYD